MELLDYLSEEDKSAIACYVQNCERISHVNINNVLKYWNRDKKKMFRCLGRNLRVKVPVDIEMTNDIFIHELHDIYQPPFGYCCEGTVNHPFILEFEKECRSKWKNKSSKLINVFESKLRDMFAYENINTGTLYSDISFHSKKKDKTMRIPAGTKTIRAIQKMLKFIDFDRMDLFEDWRNDVSNLTTSRKIHTNMVFSIHPIDFMTMSDNNCGWSSCMSWVNSGGYHAGTIEMMNSNMVIVCYLESHKQFRFREHVIPNKSWRCLLYVHKDMLLAGKSYPYINKKITIKALDIMREMLHNNMSWKYQYINQQYHDDKIFPSNSEVIINRRNKYQYKGHKIIICTNGMYNDIINSKETRYWCCRNWVPKTLILNASGVLNCLCCGKPIQTQKYINEEVYDDDDMSGYGSCCVCDECYCEKQCYKCDKFETDDSQIQEVTIKYYRDLVNYGCFVVKYCKNCMKDLFYNEKNDFYCDALSVEKWLDNGFEYEFIRLRDNKKIFFDNYKSEIAS